MVAIQIRHVPDDVRAKLSANAEAEGKSLQAYLLELLIEEARWADNDAILAAAARRPGGMTGTVEEAQAFTDRWKAERDARWEPQ
ncbi:MAG: FitA-like ribbon-helix-helix domain-containing protein [Sporichthyaceae bacterium]